MMLLRKILMRSLVVLFLNVMTLAGGGGEKMSVWGMLAHTRHVNRIQRARVRQRIWKWFNEELDTVYHLKRIIIHDRLRKPASPGSVVPRYPHFHPDTLGHPFYFKES